MDMSLDKSKYIVLCENDVFGLNCGQYECDNHDMNDLNVLKIPYTRTIQLLKHQMNLEFHSNFRFNN